MAEMLHLDTLRFEEREPGIGILTMNRPSRANSQTIEMFHEYEKVARELRHSDLSALVIAGEGGRSFCPGFDLDEVDIITKMSIPELTRFQMTATGGLREIRRLPFPVVAALTGPVAGGGLALALAADIRICSPTTRLSAAFVRIGLSAGEFGCSYMLPRLIGPGRAAELAYTGRIVDADEAAAIGLVNRIVPDDELMDQALDLSRKIAEHSPTAVRMTKTALLHNLEVGSYEAALELENRGQNLLTRTEDMAEALSAFREKRTAEYVGR